MVACPHCHIFRGVFSDMKQNKDRIFGTGAKIDCSKEHIGKRVYVLIRKR